MTPAEKMAKKLKATVNPIPWGQRIAARRPSVFAVKIKELRAELGLSQRDLATGIGSTTATVNDAEHGREINLSLALKIATFFGLSVEAIWSPLPEEK